MEEHFLNYLQTLMFRGTPCKINSKQINIEMHRNIKI